MAQSEYVFQRAEDQRELERLRMIEQVFDSASRRRLLATGLQAGWCCLEVGPGAGSVMTWMGEVVGPTGQVVAMDLDPKFLGESGQSNVEILRADIRTAQLQEQSFDLVHARYVLIHIPDYETALTKMFDSSSRGAGLSWRSLIFHPLVGSLAMSRGWRPCARSIRPSNRCMRH